MSNTYAQIVDHYGKKAGVETGRMFGAEGLKIAGKVFAMQVKGNLVVKLSAARAHQLVAKGHARLFDPGHGRLMKEWVEVDSSSKAAWLPLAEESFAFVKAGAKKKER
jgi:TfoX/Sxy family transcriptional regulator of competence genes